LAQEAVIWPGTSYPLGATYDGVGTNFALFSEVAEGVGLCLFDSDGAETVIGVHDVDRLSAFFDLVQQDPVVSQVKLIAEPWDVGEGERIRDEFFLLLLNASELDLELRIPPQRYGEQWVKVLDTAAGLRPDSEPPAAKPGDCVALPSRCMQVFSRA
jgi:Carbohydrate-binding module 48 (Isoamylase N-terminal domain)